MPGYTLGQFLILMNYTYIMLYGTFMMSNPFTDGVRPGWLAVSQLPLVFALGQKSSILGSLLGYGYEALNYIHRYVGRVIVLASNIHSLYYIYKWTANGTFLAKLAIPKFFWGFVFLIAMDVMFVFSIEYFRRKTYQLFFWSHTIGTIAMIPGGILHYPVIRPYMITCAVLYGVDRLLRAFKSSITTATLTNLPKMDMAYIEVPTIKSGWRAGQHVRLRVLSSGMGLFGWTESHPFTIASASGANDGLVLLCKKAGDWTSKLVDLAKELDGQSSEGQGQGKVKVWIEGPFGGSRMVFTGFSAAVLVVGGSGITFGLSMMEGVLAKDRNGESRLRYLELVWLVQDPESILPLLPLFQSLITVNYTRALKEKVSIFEAYEVVPCDPMALAHPNLALAPGRPDIKSILSGAIDTGLAYNKSVGPGDSSGLSGLAVGVCGPQSLGDGVMRAIGEIDGPRRARVGGIEVHEEWVYTELLKLQC
ncbi:hypothetical protein FA13DRAFT_1762022 [Coprinellus micaceus]|uniref:ferric-chelate reductase (NADPH) n=1 Tax=Coprinellus micaceus TaxID=71717 RepID=A0A4Y7TR22_COPMI|nr:hypothetical protein FA13DRAFT_1762022 [Coprinellus micaceus]